MLRLRWCAAVSLVAAACADAPLPDGVSATAKGALFGLISAVPSAAPQPHAGGRFGLSLAAMRDPNTAGARGWLLVGAPGVADVGEAYLFAGNSRSGTAAPLATYAQRDAGALADFGWSVASLGDVDRDSTTDIAIGAPGARGGQGAVFVYTTGGMGTKVPSRQERISGELAGGRFGTFVTATPDVNGDGVPDLLIGAPGQSRAHLYSSHDAGWERHATFTAQSSVRLGHAGAARDFTGDGLVDVVLGDPGFSGGAGRIVVFIGLADGGFDLAASAATALVPGARLGTIVVPVHANADGVFDLFVGAPGAGTVPGEGAGYLYSGAPGTGPTPSGTMVEPADQPDAGYASSAAYVEDVDGDSKPDLLVGAPGYGPATAPGLRPGIVFVHSGGAMVPSPGASQPIAVGAQPGSRFGAAVAGGFDFDGDGQLDFAAGAPDHDGLHGDEGSVYWLFGGAPRLDGGTGGGAGGGGGGGSTNPGGGAGGGGAKVFEVEENAFTGAVVGAPWSYNALGRITVLGGTAARFDACTTEQGFVVDEQTGAVSWTPVGVPGARVMLCVSAVSSTGEQDAYVFPVLLRGAPGSITAAFEVAPSPGAFAEALSFDGSRSMAVNGIRGWRWDFGDQSALGFGPAIKHAYARAGGYRVELTVFDGAGSTATVSKLVKVLDPLGRAPPAVQLDASPRFGPEPLQVALNSTVMPGDADVVATKWESSDGQVATTPQATMRLSAGMHRIRVTVTDANGLSGYDSVLVEVRDAARGTPPYCRAVVEPAAVAAGGEVVFDGLWRDVKGQVDSAVLLLGTSAEQARPPHRVRLPAPHVLRAKLVVTSVTGLVCTDFVDATAFAPPAIAPVKPVAVKCGARISLPLTLTGAEPRVVRVDGVQDARVDGDVLKWQPREAGTFFLDVRVGNADGVANTTVQVNVDCEALQFRTPACGCSTGAPLALAWLALALVRRRRWH